MQRLSSRQRHTEKKTYMKKKAEREREREREREFFSL